MRRSTIFDFINNLPTLTSRKVRLRPRRLEDAADQYRWRSDEEICRLDASMPTGFSYAEFYERFALELEYPGLTYTLAIDLLDGKHIGDCSLFNFDFISSSAELGILIGDKSCWGMGFGSDALQAFLQDIFINSDMEKIFLRTLEWNERARKCFEKCGFRLVGQTNRGEHTFAVMEVQRRQVGAGPQ